jgi:hypothetical protein
VKEDDFGSDELTKRISEAWHNIRATWSQHERIVKLLSSINDLFMKYVQVFCKLSKETNIESSPAAFLARAYGCYIAAVRISSSGQSAEAFVMFRACIENALYGYYIEKQPELANIWVERHQSEEAEKLTKKNFRLADILDFLSKQEPQIGPYIKDMYDRSIDYGAHPNVYSIGLNLRYIENEGKHVMDIFNNDPYILKCCLLANARFGLGCVSVFRLIYPEELRSCGVPEELGRLFGRLNELSQRINDEK